MPDPNRLILSTALFALVRWQIAYGSPSWTASNGAHYTNLLPNGERAVNYYYDVNGNLQVRKNTRSGTAALQSVVLPSDTSYAINKPSLDSYAMPPSMSANGGAMHLLRVPDASHGNLNTIPISYLPSSAFIQQPENVVLSAQAPLERRNYPMDSEAWIGSIDQNVATRGMTLRLPEMTMKTWLDSLVDAVREASCAPEQVPSPKIWKRKYTFIVSSTSRPDAVAKIAQNSVVEPDIKESAQAKGNRRRSRTRRTKKVYNLTGTVEVPKRKTQHLNEQDLDAKIFSLGPKYETVTFDPALTSEPE